MRKLRVLITIGAAAAVVASASPARADASWEDPAGDATGVGVEHVTVGDTSPRPSDAELDIVAAAITSQGDTIFATAKMSAGGFPPGSGGSVWRFFFSHKNDRYFFQAVAGTDEYSQLFTSTPRFYRVDPADPTTNGEELRCDCRMALNIDAGEVQFTIKLDSVAKALKAAPGAVELGDLELRTYRRAQYYVLSDIAPAPEGLAFRA